MKPYRLAPFKLAGTKVCGASEDFRPTREDSHYLDGACLSISVYIQTAHAWPVQPRFFLDPPGPRIYCRRWNFSANVGTLHFNINAEQKQSHFFPTYHALRRSQKPAQRGIDKGFSDESRVRERCNEAPTFWSSSVPAI
jgi:hypothetical protein